MKKILYIFMLAASVVLAACSSDDYESEGSEELGREVVIGVAMPDMGSRIAFDDLKMTWEEGDKILVTAVDSKGGLTFRDQLFTLISGAGTKYGKFKGYLVKSENYIVYYNTERLEPYRMIDRYDIRYAGMTQNGVNNTDHLNTFLLLACKGSKEMLHNVDLKIENCMLRIDMRSMPEDLTRIDTIKFAIKNERNFYPGEIRFKGDIKNITSPDEHNYIYMPFSTLTYINDQLMPITAGIGSRYELTLKGNVNYVVTGFSTVNWVFYPGCYDMLVTTDKNAVRAMNDWKRIE